MGKGKSARAKLRAAGKKGKTKAAPSGVAARQKTQQSSDVEALVEESGIAQELGDYEKAIALMQRACAAAPSDTRLMQDYAMLLAEVGAEQQAVAALQHAVTVCPDTGFEKYMYLGQLSQGEEAVKHMRTGLEVLKREIMGATDEKERTELARQASSAHVALAERLMAAAEDPTSVAEECQNLLMIAHHADRENPEPMQVMASLLYEQERQEEALAALKQSMELWFKPAPDKPVAPGDTAGANESDTPADMDADMDADVAPDCATTQSAATPSFESRFECAKLLIELDSTTTTAVQVLEDLLQENDEVPEVWYSLALAYYGAGSYEECEDCLTFGQKLLAKQRIDKGSVVAASYDDLRSALEDAKAKAKAGGGDDTMEG